MFRVLVKIPFVCIVAKEEKGAVWRDLRQTGFCLLRV